MLNFRNLVLCATAIAVSACGTNQEVTDKLIFEEYTGTPRAERQLENSELYQKAYSDGVREVVQDLKGKMQATQDFVYDPAVVECGVMIPARIVGAVLIPAHEECVQVRKGSFKETSPVYLPVIGE